MVENIAVTTMTMGTKIMKAGTVTAIAAMVMISNEPGRKALRWMRFRDFSPVGQHKYTFGG